MSFMRYPKIRALGHEDIADIFSVPTEEIVLEEKIDGANFRLGFREGEPIFGSRNRELLSEEQNKQFSNGIKYLYDHLSKYNPKDLKRFTGYIFYMEYCIPHSIQYNWADMPLFLGFDVYNIKEELFLPPHEKNPLFKSLGIETVPEISVLKVNDLKNFVFDDASIPRSKYYSGPAEGIVFKNYDHRPQMFGKLVHSRFKELNKKVFGGSAKHVKTDDERLVAKYCTNARIDKNIYKLLDEDHKLGMELMKYLPRRVTKDIYEEHWQDILWSNWKLDMHKVRNLISKRCAGALKMMVTQNIRIGGTDVDEKNRDTRNR